MLPHLDLPLTDVTWHVNVTFGVGAINIDDSELALRKQGRLCDISTTRHTGVHIDGTRFRNYNARLYYNVLLYISDDYNYLLMVRMIRFSPFTNTRKPTNGSHNQRNTI